MPRTVTHTPSFPGFSFPRGLVRTGRGANAYTEGPTSRYSFAVIGTASALRCLVRWVHCWTQAGKRHQFTS